MIFIVVHPDSSKAAHTQDADNAGCPCGETWVLGQAWGRDFTVRLFVPFQFCSMGMYYFITFNQTEKIKASASFLPVGVEATFF